ncbi:MAG: flagellar type III secretion system pore protein FliP [Lachnospiraceae bacterium]|nr:flagellar type III secretion system pore protein FliP [Lachnospiraceae bacterium]MCI9230026.1 flagellar type III secretion system pore protein FliP [Lachnospiraceae bacterium]MCI9574202.1 flagellar type III secretion system pore protein FliP [Lachnospiraceae bacterium]
MPPGKSQRIVSCMMKNKLRTKRIVTAICLLVTVGILCIVSSMTVFASGAETDPSNVLSISMSDGGNGEINGSLRILLTLTLISIAPILIIMMTSFTRIIIVLHFTRAALNTQTAPPNQILVGLALILTFFIMEPTVQEINEQAYQPYEAGEIDLDEALERGVAPLRKFMYPQTQVKDVDLFMDISGQEWDGVSLDTIPLSVLLPSFMLSELRMAFWIGFVIYIPFIVIDMVVASTLMSMGMMMLPPTTISMPFKILLFVLADGWNLVIKNLVESFYH